MTVTVEVPPRTGEAISDIEAAAAAALVAIPAAVAAEVNESATEGDLYDAIVSGVASVNTAGSTQVTAVETEGETQTTTVETAGTDAVTAIQTAGADAILSVSTTAGANQYAAAADAISQGVASVAITAAGSGGTNGTYAWTTTGGGGSGAAGYLIVSGGAITSVVVESRGKGYTSAPTLVYTVTGLTGETLTPSRSQNETAGNLFTVPVTNGFEVFIVDSGGAASTSQGIIPKTTYLATLNRDTLNAGKPFPLKSATRNGTTSSENTVWSNLLLSVVVFGGEPGEVYSFQRQTNENTGAGIYGWAINAYVESAMAATNNAVAIMAITDTAPALDRTLSKQTVVLKPPLRPKMRIVVTIDGTKLPASGTAINSNSSSSALGYSWIIDPSCHVETAPTDRFRLNSYQSYPLLPKTRDATLSAKNDILNRVLLDITVEGARPGKYYQVAYIANGAVIGVANYGVLVYEFDVTTFATASVAVIVQNYTTSISELEPANLDRTANILTFSFVPAARPEMRITMSIDPSMLPAAGTAISTLSGGATAKSWIIDPACYRVTSEPTRLGAGDLHVLATKATGALTLSWRHSSTEMKRIVIAPLTCNSLWTVNQELTASLGDPATATWTAVYTGQTSDWAPPLKVMANSGGDGSTSGNFTGGNHDSTGGGSGGNPTVANIAWRVLIDGRDLSTFTGSEVEMYGREVVLAYQSDLEGFNTIGDREIVTQRFVWRIHAGSIELLSKVAALEAVTVYTDYGPQLTSTGYRKDLHFWGGSTSAKIANWYDGVTAYTSGASSSYATESVVMLFSTDGTDRLASWIDQSYGLGDGSEVAAANPRMFSVGTGKVYQGAIRATDENGPTFSGGLVLTTGQSYVWRGGYVWSTAEAVTGDLEAAIRRFRGGKPEYLGIFPAAGDGVIVADPQDAGLDVDVDGASGVIDAEGVAVSAAAYGVVTVTL